ncbi:tail assembly chaperone [Flavobacterium sp. phage 1/32]|nr:tail assembly chaperone [Flavobacterium sp. phage 1/32]
MNKEIIFYDSPENLPIKRFQRFNKYVLIDVEVGQSFEDYDQRTHKAVAFLRKDMKEEAIKELENRRQMVYNAFEEYSPKHYALALMVKSINGQVFTDITEKGLEEVLIKLDEIGYTQKELELDLSEVKKKIYDVLEMYYPKHFKTNEEENFNIIFKNRLEAELDSIIKSEDFSEEIYNFEKQMLELKKPNIWNVYAEGNLEIQMEVEFEKFLLAVSEHTNEKIDEVSTFRFYALVDFLKEKFKPRN